MDGLKQQCGPHGLQGTAVMLYGLIKKSGGTTMVWAEAALRGRMAGS